MGKIREIIKLDPQHILGLMCPTDLKAVRVVVPDLCKFHEFKVIQT